jgi:hypothetical protein
MNKLLMYLMSFILLFTISCDSSSPTSPDDDGNDDEPVLLGCEAAYLYDWDSVEFESSLDAGATTWLAFDLSETTLFSINLNQPGFHCALFEACDGNCAPLSWIADGFCDDGAYGIYDEQGNVVPVNLWCEEFNFDEGDCEVIPGECSPGLIEDCNNICAPQQWLGDGFCDDGSYQYNGNDIYFNCEEFNNDNGDCDGQGRQTPRVFNKVIIGQ